MSWQEKDNQRFDAIEAKLANVAGVLKYTGTWDPAATAATQGAEVSTTVTVTGAALGDIVEVAHTAFDGSAAAILVGHVSAADTVKVRVINTTAVAVNIASGTLKVLVTK